jgi:nitronate monooxygenase
MARPRTALGDLLGIEYPILQSGMGGAAGPELVAEVSRAGGLGILAGLRLTAEQLRAGIRRVRELTDRPFGVNLWLHSELMPPADVSGTPEARVRQVQETLNRFRTRLGIATTQGRPPAVPDVIAAAFEVILEERVPVWSIGLGNPDPGWVKRCHERGITIIAMVATVEDARAVMASGVDIVVAQGAEAGGHRSTWVKPAPREAAQIDTMTLVPQIVDAVRIPVVASGGIADGRGLVAALALGAQGALFDTRFGPRARRRCRSSGRRPSLSGAARPRQSRMPLPGSTPGTSATLSPRSTRPWGAPVLPALVQSQAAQDIFQAAASRQEPDYFPMPTGQSMGLIHDLPGAGEVVEAIVREARAVLEKLPTRVKLS